MKDGALMPRLLLVPIFCLLLFSACSDNSLSGTTNDAVLMAKGVFIINEGESSDSSASLSLYIPESKQTTNNVFLNKNHRSLGSGANDIVLFGGKAFIAMTSSNKIEIISTADDSSLGTISLPSAGPYNLVIYSGSKAFVTNSAAGSVTDFNPTSLQINAVIPVGKTPKGIIAYNQRIFVCNSGGFTPDSTVSVIDPYTDTVIKTIVTGISPFSIDADDKGNIYVCCYGYKDPADPSKDLGGSISVIDALSGSELFTIPIPIDMYGHPGMLSVSNNGFGIVVTQNGVIKFDTNSGTITDSQFIQRIIYSIAVDKLSDRIYMGDAKDFMHNGEVLIYDPNAVLIDSASVGIAPRSFAFDY